MSAPAVPSPSASASAPSLDGLVVEVDGAPRLLGSRCAACSADTFPVQLSCARCGGEQMTPQPLPARGTVWTWTVQRFAPKPPFRGAKGFEPFALAYVDLGTVKVEGRLAGKPVGEWRIGDRVQLAVGAVTGDAEWPGYWFEPLAEGAVSGAAGAAREGVGA